jgi:glycerol-3-phosphate dehydrogenase
MPFYGAPVWQRLRLGIGLTVYDGLAFRSPLPGHRFLNRRAVRKREPGLSEVGLRGAAAYWDAQLELPERLVIELLRGAAGDGAVVRNHVAAAALQRRGGTVAGLELRGILDTETAEVRTATVINAAGPWVDETLAALGVEHPPLLRLSQGVHLVYPQLLAHAVAIEHPDDRRLCFGIPWQGQTLIGTTETELEDGPDRAAITVPEIRYLRRLAERFFTASAGCEPLWGTVGVRALPRRSGPLHVLSRRHQLIDHGHDGAAGLVTVAGGKLTAWRAIAEDVAAFLGGRRRGPASDPAISGGPPVLERHDDPAAARRWRLYGSRAAEVEELVAADPWWGEPLLEGSAAIRAELAHAFDREWAATLADAIVRRLALGFGPDLGRRAAAAAASVARQRLGWDEERIAHDLAQFESERAERVLPET